MCMYSGPEAANYQINQSIKSNKYVLFIEAFYFLVLLYLLLYLCNSYYHYYHNYYFPYLIHNDNSIFINVNMLIIM